MANTAQVNNIDALRQFKLALLKFIESGRVALSDAESELHRLLLWVETEQNSHWHGQIRLRTEALGRAKEALRHKKLFKNAAGKTPSAVEEEKAVIVAQKRLEEAEEKFANVRKHARRMQKEVEMYKGSVQRLATTLSSDLPAAASTLQALINSLDAYVATRELTQVQSTAAPAASATPGESTPAGSMARPEPISTEPAENQKSGESQAPKADDSATIT